MFYSFLFVVVALFFGSTLHADQFHFQNIIVGDRAMGLGGAYGGVADDASGVFYNPAGLAFAVSNDVSGSANAFYKHNITYKETIENEDFHERSGGSVPAFFGGLQKLDHIMPKLVFAFGVYTLDSEQKDQDDELDKGYLLAQPSQCYKTDSSGQPIDVNGNVLDKNADDFASKAQFGSGRPALKLVRFHRTVNKTATTVNSGIALGYLISPQIGIGFGLNYVAVDELVQEYQDVKTEETRCTQEAGYAAFAVQKTQNIRQILSGIGIQPVLGIQMSFFGRLSVGLTAKFGAYLSQDFQQNAEVRSVGAENSVSQPKIDAANGNPVVIQEAIVGQVKATNRVANPLGKSLPMELRFGLAYFASTRMLMTFDLLRHGAVTDMDSIGGNGKMFERAVTFNIASGMEYYLTPSIPLRLGVFSNNDARPKLVSGSVNQRDHIDYFGGTLFLGWVQPNSQIAVGVVLQEGEGEAQKISANPKIQKVEAEALTFAFSATHSF